jgi:hypothetical protein
MTTTYTVLNEARVHELATAEASEKEKINVRLL